MSKQYKYFKIGLASPEEILSWSHGEVLKHETINYRTLKPEPDGLFCEKIFGPTKDYQCACGKSKRSTDKGKICEKCGVEITESKVRRERMGHIALAAPVVHTWFLRNSPSPLATLLGLKNKDLEEVVYLASYVITDPGKVSELKLSQVINEAEYERLQMEYPGQFKAMTGAEAIKTLLSKIDLEKEAVVLRAKLKASSKQNRDKVIKKLEVVEAFLRSDNKPEWMILTVLPVLPPSLRPMVPLDGGRFATTDLNDLYRRILNRNNRLKKQFEVHAPHLITKNEKRMLQEAVDSLIDNSKRGKKSAIDKAHKLKSLSDMLRGKQGRFRQNLLGKRVDYSGRSVIVVGPQLKMYQCGIPKEMALTLFKPFVLREIIREQHLTLAAANKLCDNQDNSVWNILEEVIREHPVLLNRAPTLHRLGIQAFEPVLIEGKAIRLHPLVCTPFNADFDGDQMAIHVPLSQEAQAEARLLMLACNNILNPKDGKPVVTPSQDMILGNYYLTTEIKGEPNEGHFYNNFDEAYMAYKNNIITLHTRIFVNVEFMIDKIVGPDKHQSLNDLPSKYLFTTVGKMIFNNILPTDMTYLNDYAKDNDYYDKTPAQYFLGYTDGYKAGDKVTGDVMQKSYDEFIARDVTNPFKKKNIIRVIAEVFKRYPTTMTSATLDAIKNLGYKYSTISGISISMADVLKYEGKDARIAAGDKKVAQITRYYEMGLITDTERKMQVQAEWESARSEIEKGLWKELSQHKSNGIYIMGDSGSRGSSSNFSQLAGMRGLMNNTVGDIIEVPVKANFREGLSVAEFFISTHGARKGSTDTALKTAESGYLTRRLVDVSQNVVVSSEDCGTENGFTVRAVVQLTNGDPKTIVTVGQRALGRFAARDIVNPKTNEVIVKRNELIEEAEAKAIDECGLEEVCIRTNLTCACKNGVCVKCYGRNLATNKMVEVGEAVGVIAAQSIGEPGTQLTMRTFHTGGVASAADITQGLPRVQELFEARKPKGLAKMSEVNGTIKKIEMTKAGRVITITDEDSADNKEVSYKVDATAELYDGEISVGSKIKRGKPLVKGSLNPKDILRILNAEAAQRYIVDEVQKVYRAQDVEISDKHIEIIVRQMMRKILVVTEGGSDLLPGHSVSVHKFKRAVDKTLEAGTELPVGKQMLLGITKAALGSDSFLSASSFQETTRVLTSAAIESAVDDLEGLKENTIIGGLIPAGTGILEEESFECPHAPEDEAEDNIYAKALNDAEEHESYRDLIDDGDEESDFDAEHVDTDLSELD